MKHAALGILAASVVGAAAPPALAAASGAGGFGAVTVTLIDLTPADGVAPSISFSPSDLPFSNGHVRGEAYAVRPNDYVFRDYEHYGPTQLSAISGATATSMSNAYSALAGAAGVGFSAMSARGDAQSGIDSTGAFFSLAGSPFAMFTLAANTGVSFSVAGWAWGETTIGRDALSGAEEWGGAVLDLKIIGRLATGQQIVWDQLTEGARATYRLDESGHASGYRDAWQGDMTVFYNNWGELAANAAFAAQATAAGHTVTAVPEPAGGVMLLAGLALLGCAARRRRREEA